MFETVLSVLCLLLALTGLAWLIRWTAMRLMVPKARGRRVLLVFLDGENAEMDLRAALECTRWAERCCPMVVAVDCGLGGHTLQVCHKMCTEYGNILLVPADRLSDLAMRAPWRQGEQEE